MRYQELFEKRSNSEKNPRKLRIDELRELVAKHGTANIYCTFTTVNKLGINPNTTYGTPLGIYTYPVEYVLESNGNMPFATDAKYLHVIDASAVRLFDLSKVTAQQCKVLAQNLKRLSEFDSDVMYNPTSGMPGVNFYKFINDFAREMLTSPPKHIPKSQHGEWIDKREDELHIAHNYEHPRQKPALKTSELWRLLGVDGVLDPGTGTIHQNEPTQAVFFSIKGLKRIDTLIYARGDTLPDDYEPYAGGPDDDN